MAELISFILNAINAPNWMGGCPRRGPVDQGLKGREVSTLPSSSHLDFTTQRNKLLSELGAEIRRGDQLPNGRKLHSEKVPFPQHSVVNGQTTGVEKKLSWPLFL